MIQNQLFTSVSHQTYGQRRDYPFVTPQKASRAMKQEIRKFLLAAAEYALCHEEGEKPPRLVLRGPASLGKSSTFLREVKFLMTEERFSKLRIGFFGPTLDLVDELAAKARDMGIPARVFRGRSALKPGALIVGEKMCGKADIAEVLSAAGIGVAETLCQSRIPTGKRDADGKMEFQKVECPLAATCAYFAQMKNREPGLILGSHAYLTMPIEALKQELRLDIVIVDESFSNEAVMQNRRVNLDRLLAPKTIPANSKRYQRPVELDDGSKRKMGRGEREANREDDEADFGFGCAIVGNAMKTAMSEKREIRIEDILASYEKVDPAGGMSASDFFRHLATLEYARLQKPEIHAGMDVAVQRDLASKILARDALAFAAFWKRLAAELALRSSGTMNGIKWKWDDLIGHGSDAYVANCGYLYYPKDFKYDRVPVMIMDASASDRIIEQFLPEFEYVTMKVALPASVKICQVSDRTGSMRMYKESKTRMLEVYAFMQRLAKWTYAETLHFNDGKDRRPLFVGYKSLHEQHWLDNMLAVIRINAGGEEVVESADGSFSIAHMNGVRGVDRWKDCRIAVIGGRMEPGPSAVENLTRAIFANVPYEIGVGIVKYEVVERLLEAKDGQSETVQISQHPDELCDLVLKQIREEEMIQCLARSRPIHRAEPLTIFLLSNIPLEGYQPDCLFKWADVMPDVFDRFALNPENLVVPDRLSDLMVVAGGEWPTLDAMKRAHARRTPTAQNLYRLFSHDNDGSNLTKFGSNTSASPSLKSSLFNFLNQENSNGDNTHKGISIRNCPIKESAALGGLDLAQNEARVRFHRHGCRGLRTAVVKFQTAETLADIELRLLETFPDAYEIEITGDLTKIAVSQQNIDVITEQLATASAEADTDHDEFWWSAAVNPLYQVANDDYVISDYGEVVYRTAA